MRPRAALLTGFLAACAAQLAPSCARDPAGFQDLGIPRTTRGVQAVHLLRDRLLVTTWETEGQARLTIVPLPSGAHDERVLAGSRGSYSIAEDQASGAVYVGCSKAAAVWRYEPATGHLERMKAFDPLLTD